MQKYRIKAEDVREGDFIPSLDNGYVFEDAETNSGYMSYPLNSGGMSVAMPEDTVLISFHTSQGDEAYVMCPGDMSITIETDNIAGRDEN